MPIDSGILAALIGAGSGVVSALITAKLTSAASKASSDRATTQAAAFLAARLGPELHDFAQRCYWVGQDGGDPSSSGIWEPEFTTPTFIPLSISVDWQALPAKLMRDVLSFPQRIEAVEASLRAAGYDDPPDYSDWFLARQKGYTGLGFEAMSLSLELYQNVSQRYTKADAQLTTRLLEHMRVLDPDLDEKQRRRITGTN